MKLIDLDQTIFIPIVDESKGGVTYEMQMTVEQFFRRFINEVPPIIDAIPVEWLRRYTAVGAVPSGERLTEGKERLVIHRILNDWQKEQEEKL